MDRFSFGDAFMHYARTGGEGRFALPFILSSFFDDGVDKFNQRVAKRADLRSIWRIDRERRWRE